MDPTENSEQNQSENHISQNAISQPDSSKDSQKKKHSGDETQTGKGKRQGKKTKGKQKKSEEVQPIQYAPKEEKIESPPEEEKLENNEESLEKQEKSSELKFIPGIIEPTSENQVNNLDSQPINEETEEVNDINHQTEILKEDLANEESQGKKISDENPELNENLKNEEEVKEELDVEEKSVPPPEETIKESENPEIKYEEIKEERIDELNPEYSDEKEKARNNSDEKKHEVSHEIVKEVSYEGKDGSEFIGLPGGSQTYNLILEKPEESSESFLKNIIGDENKQEDPMTEKASVLIENPEITEEDKTPIVELNPEIIEPKSEEVKDEPMVVSENFNAENEVSNSKQSKIESEAQKPEQTEKEAEITPHKRLEMSNSLKEKAKGPINEKDFSRAKTLYEEALYFLHPSFFSKASENEYKEMVNLSCLLMNNIVFCDLNLGLNDEAIRLADRVLIAEPNNVKALYRKALAFRKKNDPENAWESIKKATAIARKAGQNIQEVEKCFEEIKEDYKKYQSDNKEKEKDFYSRMMSNQSKEEASSTISESSKKKTSSNPYLKYLVSIPASGLGVIGSYLIFNKQFKSSKGILLSTLLSLGFWGVLASKENSKRGIYLLLTSIAAGIGKYIGNNNN